HAEDIKRAGKRVKFKVRIDDHVYRCDLPLHGERRVKSTSGHSQNRVVVVSRVKVGRDVFDAEITLTDRTDMGVPMLLGRATIRGRYVVHPGRSFLLSRNRRKAQ
ncbi:MAG: RimK/LysX family protein, partial [Aestuariivirga sp.]